MNTNYKETIWDKLREVLSHVNIKTYIYGILVLGVLIMILINVKDANKYGHLNKNGKFVLDIENVARDYGLDIDDKNTYYTAEINYMKDPDANLTFDLSQDLVLTNIVLQQSGVSDTVTRGKILTDIIEKYKTQFLSDTYNESDISLTRNEDRESLLSYYEEIAGILANYTEKLNAVSNGNIEQVYSLNDNIIKTLIATPATKVGAQYQLKLINIFARQNAFITSAGELNTDPVKYLALGGDSYKETYKKEIVEAIDDFISYFKSLNIY
jgi:hypothetical protein